MQNNIQILFVILNFKQREECIDFIYFMSVPIYVFGQ